MAYAPLGIEVVSGSFVEVDHGKTFDYIENPEFVLHVPAHGGKNVHFPHLIFVGPPGSTETRRALVMKTCVHVVTDETEDGYTIEKWITKQHRKYAH